MKKLIGSGFIGAVAALAVVVLMGARDGNGTYTLPVGNPVSNGQTITDTLWNTTFSDIATALTNSLSKDGQTVPTAHLPMGGFKHTNVGDATARSQYASAAQVQDSSLHTLSSVAGTNTVTGILTPAITSYATGALVTFTPANSNTGATTLAISGLSARSIVKHNGSALVANDLVAGIPAVVVASASQFILLNPLTDMTAAQITGDGAGSGLDADLLDGLNGTAYLRNIVGKTGTNVTLSTSAASGGSDGDVWIRY